LISIVAILTMTLGNLVAAVQSNVKRMMAYSSIAQAGYILIGFVASLAGVPGVSNLSGKSSADVNAAISYASVGNAAVLFFILVYVLTNLGAFSGIIALADATGGERIDDFRGLAKRAPLLSLGTALCLLSLAGIPPLAGFMSKVFIFTAAWSHGGAYPLLIWLVIIGLINSVISLVYYGRIVRAMYFDAPVKEDYLATPIGLSSSITLTTAALIVLFFIAQVVFLAASPAANSLFAFLLGR